MQRVSEASVVVDHQVVGEIGAGLCVFVGVTHSDTDQSVHSLAEKLVKLRIFGDSEQKMNLSVVDVEAEILVVSQFTLYGDVRKGARPSFGDAAGGSQAEPLVESLIQELTERGVKVASGRFGADMDVHLVNDGPVTLMLEMG